VACNLGLGVARTLVVARLLGARELGVMGIALLTLGTVDAFTATGVETALVSQPGDVRRDLDSAFAIQALRGLLLTALLWAAAPFVAAFFGTAEAAPVIRAVAVTALLRGLSNPAVILLVKRIEFRRLFWWSLPEVVVGFALAVGVALVRRDVWALVAGAVGAQATATAASYAMLPRRPGLAVSREAVRRLLGYGKWVSGTRILAWIGLSADNAVVGRLLGAGALGVYQLAFRVGELAVTTFTRAVVQVALPAFSELREGPRLRRGFRAVLRPVLAEAARLAALGITVGVPAALALTRLLSKFLYGVAPTDPRVLGAVVLCLFCVALIAALVPAWRASRVNPLVALRYE